MNVKSTFKKLVYEFYNSGFWMCFYGVYNTTVIFSLGRYWPADTSNFWLQISSLFLIPVLLVVPLILFWFLSFERYIRVKNHMYHDSMDNSPIANPHITSGRPLRLSIVLEFGPRVEKAILIFKKPKWVLIRLLDRFRGVIESKTPEYKITFDVNQRTIRVFFFELKLHARASESSTFELVVISKIGKRKGQTLLTDFINTSF